MASPTGKSPTRRPSTAEALQASASAAVPAMPAPEDDSFVETDRFGLPRSVLNADVLTIERPVIETPQNAARIACACHVGNHLWAVDRAGNVTVIDMTSGEISRRIDAAAFFAPLARRKTNMTITDAMEEDKTRVRFNAIHCCVVANEESEVWMGGQDGLLHVFDAVSMKKINELKKHIGSVRCLAYDPASRLVFSGGEDFKVMSWKVGPHRAYDRTFNGHRLYVTAIAADGTGLMSSGCAEGAVSLWSVATGRCLCARSLDHGMVTHMTWATCGGVDRLAVAFENRSIEWYSVECSELYPYQSYRPSEITSSLRVLALEAHGACTYAIFNNDATHILASQPAKRSLKKDGPLLAIHEVQRELPSRRDYPRRPPHKDSAEHEVGDEDEPEKIDAHQAEYERPVVYVPGRAYTSFSFVTLTDLLDSDSKVPLPFSLAQYGGFTKNQVDGIMRRREDPMADDLGSTSGVAVASVGPTTPGASPSASRTGSPQPPTRNMRSPMSSQKGQSSSPSGSKRGASPLRPAGGTASPSPGRQRQLFQRTSVSEDDKLQIAMRQLDETHEKKEELKTALRALHGSVQELRAKVTGNARQHSEIAEVVQEFVSLVRLQQDAGDEVVATGEEPAPEATKTEETADEATAGSADEIVNKEGEQPSEDATEEAKPTTASDAPPAAGSKKSSTTKSQRIDPELVRIMCVTLATLGYDITPEITEWAGNGTRPKGTRREADTDGFSSADCSFYDPLENTWRSEQGGSNSTTPRTGRRLRSRTKGKAALAPGSHVSQRIQMPAQLTIGQQLYEAKRTITDLESENDRLRRELKAARRQLAGNAE